MALTGDIRKAFLQVRIREQDRNALRFHYPVRIHTYRFARVLFGLGPSPFLLVGVIKHHLNRCQADYLECVGDIERELYVDDLLTGALTIKEAEDKKSSNVKELELDKRSKNEDKLSYASQQLGVKSSECGLLGMKWNKATGKIGLIFPADIAQPTKGEILTKGGQDL